MGTNLETKTVRRVNQTKIIYKMQKNRKQCKGQNTLITIFYAQHSVSIAFKVPEPGSELNLETVQYLGDGSLWKSEGGDFVVGDSFNIRLTARNSC